MALILQPEEALILFVRRSPADPPRYIVGIRACQTSFDHRKDLQPVNVQRTICEAGESTTLNQALDVAVQRLQQVASGSIPL
jgi:hypothetical protein